MPTIHMLIGLPGSGKSFWRAVNIEDQIVVSNDDYVDNYAATHGLTYSQAFKDVAADADKVAKIVFRQAVNAGANIIVDRTNMSAKSRAKFLSQLPKNYERIAVVFTVPDDELKVRLQKRGDETGKYIPDFVVEMMRATYQEPTLGEFDRIERIEFAK